MDNYYSSRFIRLGTSFIVHELTPRKRDKSQNDWDNPRISSKFLTKPPNSWENPCKIQWLIHEFPVCDQQFPFWAVSGLQREFKELFGLIKSA